MSIMVGMTTQKFVMIAAAMCLPARVDHERVEAAIDDNAPVSVISTKLAARLHIDAVNGPIHLRKPIRISIGAEEFSTASVMVGDAAFGDRAHVGRDLILGDDMIRSQIIEIDFAARTLKLILPYERDHHIKGFRPVAVMRTAKGDAQIQVRFAGGQPVPALLDLGSETPVAIDAGAVDRILPAGHANQSAEISLGDARSYRAPVTIKNEWADTLPVRVGLGMFDSRIILDMPHDRLWVPPD